MRYEDYSTRRLSIFIVERLDRILEIMEKFMVPNYYGKDINEALKNRHFVFRWMVYISLILAIIFLGTFKSTNFMYFQF